MKLSTANLPWNQTDKKTTSTDIPPHVTIFTMLVAIRTSQDAMENEILGNIVAELRNRVTFGGFSEEMMQ